MTIEQIRYKVFLVIAANSEYTIKRIDAMYDLPLNDPTLDTFVAPGAKARLARALKRELPCVKSTELTNQLYVTVKTLSQLIKQITIYCPPTVEA